ncbi:hypothetical protein [Streptosporangium sp. NPDC002721]|uniref:hypothetical protein n=1 Tax=Streptosporangium sp. NPDC002721 TaxID=3366188 RepID=UPI0036957A38
MSQITFWAAALLAVAVYDRPALAAPLRRRWLLLCLAAAITLPPRRTLERSA